MKLTIGSQRLSHFVLFLSLISMSTVGYAQGSVIEEIVVTAEKREVSLQDVSLAVSAFSQDRLDQSGISTINELQNVTPNLQFTTVGNFGPHVILTMRGVGTDVVTSNADTGVALYQDGVYMGRSSAALMGFYDVERVEVLRGPQGTLYGRNSTGGSINVLSARPGDEFEAYAEALFGEFDHGRFRGFVNMPFSDTVSGRFTVSWEERDGYMENLVPGVADKNDIDNVSVRGQLLIDVNDNLDVLLRGFYSDTGGVGSTAQQWGGRYPPFAVTGIIPVVPGVFGAPNIFPGIFNVVEGGAAPVPDDLHKVRNDFEGSEDHTFSGGNIEITIYTDHFDVRSLTAWVTDDSDLSRDGDLSELALWTKGRMQKSEQFSQEITLTSNGDGALSWIAGLYYFDEDIDDVGVIEFINNSRWALLAGRPPFSGALIRDPNERKTKSIAGYGQLEYAMTDRLTATLGLRYTEDDKEGGNPERSFYDPRTNTPLAGWPQSWVYDDSWEETTGKIGMSYDLSENNLLYLSYSKGFKSGGTNVGGLAFDPESIYSWELGSKNRFADNRLEVNAAFFRSEYEDMQLFTVGLTQTIVDNASDSTLEGFEIETVAALSDSVRLDASVAYLNAEFDNFVTSDPLRGAPGRPPAPAEDLSGNKLPRSPEWEVNLGADVQFPVAGGQLTMRVEYHWQDEMYFRAFNRESLKQDSWDVFNARATYTSPGESWHVSIFGKNLGDEEYATNIFPEAVFFGGPAIASIAPPRTWGIELGRRFR